MTQAAVAESKELTRENKAQTYSSSATFNQPAPNVFPAQKKKLLDALQYLTSLDDNWNGHGAVAPTLPAANSTQSFLNSLILSKSFADIIEPNGDGGVSLVWSRSGERVILTLDGSALHLSHEYPDGKIEFLEDVLFIDQDIVSKRLPAEILEHIPARTT